MPRPFLYISYLFCAILFFEHCATNNDQEIKEKPLATVSGAALYQYQLLNDLPDELSGEDSINFAKQYIDNWINEQLLLQKAEEVLPEQAKDVESQLEKYRRSLLIFAYEQQYIKERLDTNVSDIEIEQFYTTHQEEFTLRDYIVKVLYLKYTQNTPNLEQVSQWYKLKTLEDIEQMNSHAQNYSVMYHYDTTNWMFFADVVAEIPLQDINVSSFIRNKKKVTFEEGEFVYYLNVLDYKLKDEVSPLEFERDKIVSILLNIRTNVLRKKLEKELYQDAMKGQKIEIFN